MSRRAGWSSVPIKALYRRRNETGNADLPLLSVYRELGVVPRAGREDNYNRPGEDLATYRVVHSGDLVLNKMKTWQGSLGISAYHGIVSPAYFVCEQIGPAEPRFVHHLLRSRLLIAEYAARSKGIRPSQWDLPWDEFRDIRVDLPNRETQSRIANFLDTETARIDALIEKKQQVIEVLDERFGADLEERLLGSEPWGTGSRLYPTLGSDRRLWKIKHLSVKIGSGKTPTGGAETYALEGVAFLRSQNVLMGCLNLADVAFIDPLVDEEMRTTRVSSGDVLLNITGASLGRCSVVPTALGPANVNQHVCIIRPRSGVSGTLLHYAIRSRAVQEQIRQEQVGGNRDGMNFEQVGNLVLALPTALVAQGQLTDHLVKVEETHRRAVSALERQIELFREHRQALITAAVTGDLDLSEAA